MMADRYGLVCVLSLLPDGVSAPKTEWLSGFPDASICVGDGLAEVDIKDMSESSILGYVFRGVDWAMRQKIRRDGLPSAD